MTFPPTHLTYSRGDFTSDLGEFCYLVSEVQVEFDLNTAVGELQAARENHGLSDVIAVTIYYIYWNAVFDMVKMALVKAYSVDAAYPRAVLTSGSLLRLIIDYFNDGNS